MDIKAKIEEVINKVQNDKDFAAKFTADPVKAVEGVLGVDLPDDQINGIISAVKAKLASGELMGAISGATGGNGGDLMGALGGLLGGNKE
ncbi:MAG: hypothetical protein J5851_05395 [Oscillospiraceae bacterium]|nr:hypothetical protein [Oscillospiraceae bacterium]